MTRSQLGAGSGTTNAESRGGSTLLTNQTSRRTLLGTAGAVAGTSLAGCLGSTDGIRGGDDERDPVKIGVLYGGTGSSQIAAARVAAAELNDDGGILGREVDVVPLETKSSPTEARRSYHRLVLQEDVDATMGISTTNVLEHLIEDFAEQETLHFTTGVGSVRPPKLIEENYEKYKYHFRTGPANNEQQVQIQLAFMQDFFPQRGWDSVALLMEGYPWTAELLPTLEQWLPQFGIDVAYSRRYRPSRDDFTAIYDDIESSGADVAWVGMGHTGNKAVRQWANQQRDFEFGGVHISLQVPSYYDDLGRTPRYTFTQTAATPTSELTPLTQPFIERYRSATGGSAPIYTSYHMYDSVIAYAEAVERAGSFDTESVIEELEELEIDGTTGQVSYDDESGPYPHDRTYDPTDDAHSGSVFFQWQENDDGEGVQEVIWPDQHRTAEYTSPPWI